MKTKSLWITNISNRNVSLADLNLTIKAFSSINLLDKKHYYYNDEQIENSIKSGSIFKKRNKIVVRKVEPEIIRKKIGFLQDNAMPLKERSGFVFKEEIYEELNMSDEEFAKENADLVDTLPVKE